MPHRGCSVCALKEEDLKALNAARAAGDSVRALARRFGKSPAALDRHFHHDDVAKTRKNIGQIARIDDEIKKLIRAQNRAKKKRDTAGALAIARELRNWFVLRTKAEIAAIGANDSAKADDQQLSPGEAVALAQAVLEGALDDAAVRAWIAVMAERIKQVPDERATGNLPDGQT